MSNEPTAADEPNGAIDNEFAANEREARDQIEDALADHNRSVEPGDIAIDLVYHRPIFVRRVVADSCVAYWEDGEDFDITTYKAHPYLPVTADDRVVECVFIPTKPGDITHEPGSKTYDYPTGRLARVPVEHLWDSKRRYQDDQKASFLAAVFAQSERDDRNTAAVESVARSVFGDDVVDDAVDRAAIEPVVVD